MTGPRSSFHLIKIAEDIHASRLASELNILTRAQLAVRASQAMPGDTALVELNEVGCAVAELLVQQGVKVVGVRSEMLPEPGLSSIDVIEPMPESLQSVYRSGTHSRGFTLLVVGLGQWLPRHGLRMLEQGGTLIDLDGMAADADLSQQVGMLVRTDLAVHAGRPHVC